MNQIYDQALQLQRDCEHIKILQKFYAGMRSDKAKIYLYVEKDIENVAIILKENGLDYRSESPFSYNGPTLEENELQFRFIIYDLTPKQLVKIYARHIMKDLNMCLYYDLHKNQNICLNLDMNKVIYGLYDAELQAKLREAILLHLKKIIEVIRLFGMNPIVVPSGSGFHVYIRFDTPIDNIKLRKLYDKIVKTYADLMIIDNVKSGKDALENIILSELYAAVISALTCPRGLKPDFKLGKELIN